MGGAVRLSGAGLKGVGLAEKTVKAEKKVMSDIIIVKANFDPEAGVWYTESSDIHGLRIEAASFDALVARIPGA